MENRFDDLGDVARGLVEVGGPQHRSHLADRLDDRSEVTLQHADAQVEEHHCPVAVQHDVPGVHDAVEKAVLQRS
jgi:hypothetical protein